MEEKKEKELNENETELSEYEKELANKLAKTLEQLGTKNFKNKLDKTLVGVQFIKQIGYCWAKEQATDIYDRRQVLIYNKIYKSYCVLSLYGLSVNWEIAQNPQDYILYQLW